MQKSLGCSFRTGSHRRGWSAPVSDHCAKCVVSNGPNNKMQHSMGKLNSCTTSRINCSAATIFSAGSQPGVNVPCGKSDECKCRKLHSVDDSVAGAQSGIDAGMEVFSSAPTRTISRSFTRKSPPLPSFAVTGTVESAWLGYYGIVLTLPSLTPLKLALKGK